MTALADNAVDGTRAALSRAAHDLLATEGPGALTVRRLAARAGVSTMNVYSRFGGKDGVLDELFTAGFTRLTEAVAAVPETDDPLVDLRGAGRAYLHFARTSPTYYSLMFDRVVPDYVPGESARAVAEATFVQLVGLIRRAMTLGAITDGDPVTTAAGVWSHVHGLASLESICGAAGGPSGLVDEDWSAIADAALAAHVRGLAAPAGTGR